MNNENKKQMYYLHSIEPSTKGDGKNYWRRIGAGFVNRDGSINVKLNFVATPTMNLQLRLRPEGERA